MLAALNQTDVQGKTNEITRFAPPLEPLDLAGAVVTADALHTQREHAEYLVTQKDAHYILVVKKNQPSLYSRVKTLPWRKIPTLHAEDDHAHPHHHDPGHQPHVTETDTTRLCRDLDYYVASKGWRSQMRPWMNCGTSSRPMS